MQWVRRPLSAYARSLILLAVLLSSAGRPSPLLADGSYLGFDMNAYPGDAALPALRKSFAYTGYWLNQPPGATNDPWLGKRSLLKQQGFGFLLLFNGRLDRDLKGRDAAALGRDDAADAVRAARTEGFPAQSIIFLDQEEGGRLLPEQMTYLAAWVNAVRSSGFRAGVYCSGISAGEGAASTTTAQDILDHRSLTGADLTLWVAQDSCPPAPGCVLQRRLAPRGSGVAAAAVWQYAQSPRRPQFTAECAHTYERDGNCYAPGLPHSPSTFLDLNVASSPDPSGGR